MRLKNLPTDEALPLAGLIQGKPHQITSKSLVDADAFSMMLMAFDEAESVSEERYPGDVLYLLLEGRVSVTLPERNVLMRAGDAFVVPVGVPHAVEAESAVKLLQLGLADR